MPTVPRRAARGKKATPTSSPTLPSPRPDRLTPPKLAPESAPRAAIPPPAPLPRETVSLQKILDDAIGGIDGARESVEELLWNASDATSEKPDMEPTSLHVSCHEHAANAFHGLREIQRKLSELRWRMSRRGVA